MDRVEGSDLTLSKEDSNLLLQTHLAEYAALTNRITYWISIQYAVYGFAAAAMGFVAGAWGHVDQLHLVWASLLILLFLLWGLAHTIFEMFAIMVYLETTLRGSIRTLLKNCPFWGYEASMAAVRKSRFMSFDSKVGLFPMFTFGVLATCMFIVRYLRWNWRLHWQSNAIWLACCSYVAVMTFFKWRAILDLRKRMPKA